MNNFPFAFRFVCFLKRVSLAVKLIFHTEQLLPRARRVEPSRVSMGKTRRTRTKKRRKKIDLKYHRSVFRLFLIYFPFFPVSFRQVCSSQSCFSLTMWRNGAHVADYRPKLNASMMWGNRDKRAGSTQLRQERAGIAFFQVVGFVVSVSSRTQWYNRKNGGSVL